MLDTIQVVAADIDMTLTSKGSDLPPVTMEAFEVLHRNVKLNRKTGGHKWKKGCF